ncbi:MAG: hypothetical protein QY331_07415 [Melioribacteraceae bacterium]|jgi:predicted glycosyltransferase|nr:MAG: hypothetical protein QY331_07415 [Melioribacteraceae bacterium]
MKYLFYLVHPSKYYLFRKTINELIYDGHKVKILISSKDVLNDLIKTEDWDYVNIFPEGRNSKKKLYYINKIALLFKTIIRLKPYAKKDYDFFITDDLLGFWGKLINVKTYFFTDDDIGAIKYLFFFMIFCDYIICPKGTNLGILNSRRIQFNAFKQSAYLHPNVFIPNQSIIRKYKLREYNYVIIRKVSLHAIHDKGKEGLNLKTIDIIKNIFKEYTIITIQEDVNGLMNQMTLERIQINPSDILDIIYYARCLVGDSQTMCAEAAFLGTPFIWSSHFLHKVPYLELLINKYKLGYAVELSDYTKIRECSLDILNSPFKNDTIQLFEDTIDLSEELVKLFNFDPRNGHNSKQRFL